MNRNKHQLRHTFLIAAAFAAGLLLSPVISQAADASESAGDYTRGVKAWQNNCSRCHNMRDPKEFRDDLWKPIVFHMRLRAGLTGQDTRDILTFLQESN